MLFRIDVEHAEVRAECARRLVLFYGARDIAHAERLIVDDGIAALNGDGAATARRAVVTALGDASKRLRAMNPIPATFADDKWWTAPAA